MPPRRANSSDHSSDGGSRVACHPPTPRHRQRSRSQSRSRSRPGEEGREAASRPAAAAAAAAAGVAAAVASRPIPAAAIAAPGAGPAENPFTRSIFGATDSRSAPNLRHIEALIVHWRTKISALDARMKVMTNRYMRLTMYRQQTDARGQGTSPASRPNMRDAPGDPEADIDGALTRMEDGMREVWRMVDGYKFVVRGMERCRACRGDLLLLRDVFEEFRGGLGERYAAGLVDLALLAEGVPQPPGYQGG